MRKQFIVKQGASNYYLVSGNTEGCGGFLDPPGRATHTSSIQEFRGGHCTGLLSLENDESWLPVEVKRVAKRVLREQPGNPRDEAWIKSVYDYFRNCYSPDGVDRNVSKCLIPGQNYDGPQLPKEYALAYLWVKKFDVNREVREDLL